MLLSLTNINKFYNGNQVLNNINLTVNENDRIGLVGVNGCGKSTLLKIITGSVNPDRFTERDGIVSFANKTSIGYLEQMGSLNTDNTVITEMRSVFSDYYKAIDRLREIEVEIADGNNSGSDEYMRLSSWLEANDGYNTDVKIRMVLNGMGFGNEELERTVSGFSGGEKTRLAIARLYWKNQIYLYSMNLPITLTLKLLCGLRTILKDIKELFLLFLMTDTSLINYAPPYVKLKEVH